METVKQIRTFSFLQNDNYKMLFHDLGKFLWWIKGKPYIHSVVSARSKNLCRKALSKQYAMIWKYPLKAHVFKAPLDCGAIRRCWNLKEIHSRRKIGHWGYALPDCIGIQAPSCVSFSTWLPRGEQASSATCCHRH
jgi:hypothetical protein